MQIPFYFNTYLKNVEKKQFSFVTKLIKQIKQKKEYAIIFNIRIQIGEKRKLFSTTTSAVTI